MKPYEMIFAAVLAAVLAGPGFTRDAHAEPAPTLCVADLIVGVDPGCPDDSGPCSITLAYDITGSSCSLCDGGQTNGERCSEVSDCPGGTCASGAADCCELDFGDRDVTVASTGTLDFGFRRLIIRAGSFTVESGGLLDGEGNGSSFPENDGGIVEIVTSGDVDVQGPNGRIEVSARNAAGEIDLTAGGSVTIDGKLRARNFNLVETASGGYINISTGANLKSDEGSVIIASGGREESGGVVQILAAGYVELAGDVNVGGNTSSEFEVEAAGDVTITGTVDVSASGEDGDGGSVGIIGGGQVTLGKILSDGANDGMGGTVEVEADGDIVVTNDISAKGAEPSGDSEGIELSSVGGSISIRAGARLLARGAEEGYGGEIILGALEVISSGELNCSGGDGGGDINVFADWDVTLNGVIDARGRRAGSFGGDVSLVAGVGGEPGDLTVNRTVDVSASGCTFDLGCGNGGSTDLVGCSVTVGDKGSLVAVGGDGGENTLRARRQLTIAGAVAATASESAGLDGTNTFVYSSQRPPILTGTVSPEPNVTACCAEPGDPSCDGSCAGLCEGHCLSLCDCDRKVIDEFEECDGQAGCDVGWVCVPSGAINECTCIATCGTVAGIQAGEDCDGLDLNQQSCTSQDFPGGNKPGGGLSCTEDCRFDYDGCVPRCGDGFVGPGEACDTDFRIEQKCRDRGFFGGELTCSVEADCTEFDESGCDDGECGDEFPCGVVGCTGGPDGGPEECDDGNSSNHDGCLNDCSRARCGDGEVCSDADCDTPPGSGPEECDDGNGDDNDACKNDCRVAFCGDGVPCSDPDSCTSGPGGGAEECDGDSICCLSTCALRPCNETGPCLPLQGCCPEGETCDDGNPCTDDRCSKFSGCLHMSNSETCDDGNACTENDRCNAGQCNGTAIRGCCLSDLDCDDGNSCTEDRCDVASHACVNEEKICKTTDRCLVGSCNKDGGVCQFARRVGFEFLDCLVIHDAGELAASIDGFAEELGPKETRRLGNLVTKANRKIMAAKAKGQGKKAFKQLNKAETQLKKLAKRLQKLAKKGNGDIADALAVQVTAIQLSIQAVKAEIS